MFEDYKKAILDFYRIKKENHHLSLNLEAPRRDRLRAECAKVFLRKNSKVDQDFIRSVFDPTNEYEDQMRSIEKFDLDRFRPLISFLTIEGRTIRDDRLVKLLAWLIDFPPYNEWRELSEEELKLIFEEAAKKQIEEEENTHPEELVDSDILKPFDDEKNVKEEEVTVKPPNQPTLFFIPVKTDDINTPKDNKIIDPEPSRVPTYTPRFSPRYITISCIILLFVGTTSFAVWERHTKMIRVPEASEKFMYWDEDHYEPVNGDKQNIGGPIIPLNVQTLTQQRKINLPDTLTSYSIGKVWYKGYGDNHEYFTAAGVYPPDTVRTLKKLSPGILRDHISYYRYLLTRLVWFICAAFFISLCGFAVSKLEKEVKPSEEETETEKEEITEFHSNELQTTSA